MAFSVPACFALHFFPFLITSRRHVKYDILLTIHKARTLNQALTQSIHTQTHIAPMYIVHNMKLGGIGQFKSPPCVYIIGMESIAFYAICQWWWCGYERQRPIIQCDHLYYCYYYSRTNNQLVCLKPCTGTHTYLLSEDSISTDLNVYISCVSVCAMHMVLCACRKRHRSATATFSLVISCVILYICCV